VSPIELDGPLAFVPYWAGELRPGGVRCPFLVHVVVDQHPFNTAVGQGIMDAQLMEKIGSLSGDFLLHPRYLLAGLLMFTMPLS